MCSFIKNETQDFLLRPLLQIAIPAKHLTVVRRCLTAFAPRRDMVGMHLLKFKSLTTDQAFMALSLVGGERIPSIEGPDREAPFLAGQ